MDNELEKDPAQHLLPSPQRIAASRQGMVATAHYRATEAGASILAAGGNAMDAAVAAAFALGVCEPAASGLGGQTMMVLYETATRRRVALDGSSRAPHRATPGELSKAERRRGHRATTVPSTPAVLAYALQRYGTMDLSQILQPAIELAEQGYQVTQLQHDLTKRELKKLKEGTAAPLFLRNGQKLYRVGAVFRQPQLAATLNRLAEAGVEDFYQGEIARLIHKDMLAHDGLIRDDDLAQIPWPVERKPLMATFGDQRLFTMGPPGAGRVLVEILNILDCFPESQRNPDTPRGAALLAEVIRLANIDRQDRPFDPSIYHQLTEKVMLDTDYAKKAARKIRTRIRTSGETTHLSVMDRSGNMVALTQSIEGVFGSFAASPELGFLYNNYMSAYEYQDKTHPYFMRPGAVPWASVAPTVIFRKRKPWLAIGSPGSERIASAIAQVLLQLERKTPFEAVDAPRLHCSVKGRVSLEASRMRSDIPEAMSRLGLEIDPRDPYSFYLGCVQMVLREGKTFIGVADPRRDGSAGGPLS